MNIYTTESWKEAKREARSLRDGFGMPIDKEILETVAIFRLMGFATSMSCAGHLRRNTDGPYILFKSVKAEQLESKCKKIADPKDPNFQKFAKQARAYSILEKQKLVPYLEEFYSERLVPYQQRLVLRTSGMSRTYINCQGADTALVIDSPAKKSLLQANRAEMKAFTEFLKARVLTKSPLLLGS